MRHFFSILIVVLFPILSWGQQQHNACQQNKRAHWFGLAKAFSANCLSDTIDVAHYNISIDLVSGGGNSIVGECRLDFSAILPNTNLLSLDLSSSLVCDSVKLANAPLNFTHNDSKLNISFPIDLPTDSEQSLHVFYHGQPEQDASGWGGFYFNNGYAFNLGVGFDAEPHNFGRAWFPCVDNFVERSSYEVRVLHASNKKAYCGGEKISEVEIESGKTLTHWSILEEIPTYLASIAVGPYDEILDTYMSSEGVEIPVLVTSSPSGMDNATASFENLEASFHAFENAFGPYRWNRVGYALVPFNSGAMEHASNIAYPQDFANGSLDFETVMAHELAHHWWGDLVTCRTQEDMWINEGMASYCEAVFIEQHYGEEAYIEYVKNNHRDVLLRAHRQDGSYLPISGIGHEHTYGSHVYNKGASVAHSLRGYMGQEAFFEGTTAFLEANQFSDVSSEDFRDFLADYTPADLTAFFENWVFSPGFVDFTIEDESISEVDDLFYLNLDIRQRAHYAESLFENVQIEITAYSSTLEPYTSSFVVSGALTNVEMVTPFQPQFIVLNADQKINLGALSTTNIFYPGPNPAFGYAQAGIQVSEFGSNDSIWMRIENHFTAPFENQPQAEFVISEDRFWRIRTNQPEDFAATLRFDYYGDADFGNYYDPILFEQMAQTGLTEDSLLLVYRPNPQSPWSEVEGVDISTSISTTDFRGNIKAPQVQQGDYAFAYGTGIVGVEGPEVLEVKCFPNPVVESLTISGSKMTNEPYSLIDSAGKTILSGTFSANRVSLDMSMIAPGEYILRVGHARTGQNFTQKIMKQ